MNWSLKVHHTLKVSIPYLVKYKCQETTDNLKQMSRLTINFSISITSKASGRKSSYFYVALTCVISAIMINYSSYRKFPKAKISLRHRVKWHSVERIFPTTMKQPLSPWSVFWTRNTIRRINSNHDNPSREGKIFRFRPPHGKAIHHVGISRPCWKMCLTHITFLHHVIMPPPLG